VPALSAGFEVRDAIALLRLDDLYVECFEIKDVKVSQGVGMRALKPVCVEAAAAAAAAAMHVCEARPACADAV
jgi:hypothetical protein